MEIKVKREFDLAGDVYGKFKENKDVFLTNKQIYDLFEIFWEKNCSDLKTEEHPGLYIVGAQPGAGKTGLVAKIQSETELPVLTGDQYRVCHPNAFSFLNNDNYTEYTSPINFLICMLTIARCFDRNIGFIMENPLKNPMQNITYMEEAIKRDYSVNLLLMAVNRFDSFLGIYNRGANLIKFGNVARFTSNKTHDEGYDGVLKTLELPEIISKLNSIAIYNRNLETICKFDNAELLKYTKLKIDFIKRTIEKERTRLHTKEEMVELEKQKLMVLDYIDKGLIPIDRETFLKELESRKVSQKILKM